MFFPQQSPLLTKQSLAVTAKGDLVVLTIGNVDLPMSYEHALDLSRWIRKEAQLIKRAAGRGRTVRSLGILEDAEFKPKPLPNHKPGIHVKERLHAWGREDVSSRGRLVCTKIGGKQFDLHFENALKVSQWLRMRAKEAKARAGDTERHWSVIGNLEA